MCTLEVVVGFGIVLSECAELEVCLPRGWYLISDRFEVTHELCVCLYLCVFE